MVYCAAEVQNVPGCAFSGSANVRRFAFFKRATALGRAFVFPKRLENKEQRHGWDWKVLHSSIIGGGLNKPVITCKCRKTHCGINVNSKRDNSGICRCVSTPGLLKSQCIYSFFFSQLTHTSAYTSLHHEQMSSVMLYPFMNRSRVRLPTKKARMPTGCSHSTPLFDESVTHHQESRYLLTARTLLSGVTDRQIMSSDSQGQPCAQPQPWSWVTMQSSNTRTQLHTHANMHTRQQPDVNFRRRVCLHTHWHIWKQWFKKDVIV